jgi:hypothetical protein
MEIEPFDTQPYDVVAFDSSGVTEIIATYPK